LLPEAVGDYVEANNSVRFIDAFARMAPLEDMGPRHHLKAQPSVCRGAKQTAGIDVERTSMGLELVGAPKRFCSLSEWNGRLAHQQAFGVRCAFQTEVRPTTVGKKGYCLFGVQIDSHLLVRRPRRRTFIRGF
jgi:hypothetical protein